MLTHLKPSSKLTCEGGVTTGYGENYNELTNFLSVDLARRAFIQTEEFLNGKTSVFTGLQTESGRLPGLRRYNAEQLFTLAVLQRHCSISNDEYNKLKVFYEKKIPDQSRFNHLWVNSKALQTTLECKPSQISRECGDSSY